MVVKLLVDSSTSSLLTDKSSIWYCLWIRPLDHRSSKTMEDATDNLLVLQNSASNQFALFCYGTLLSLGLITSRLCSRSWKCCLSTFVGVWSELYDNIFHLTVRFQLNYRMAWSRYHFHLVYVYISLHAKCCIFEYDALNGCTFMFIGPGSGRCTKIKT